MEHSPPKPSESSKKKRTKLLGITGVIITIVLVVMLYVLVPGVKITDDDATDSSPGVAVWLKNYNMFLSKTVTVEVTLVFDNYETYSATRTFTLEPGEYTSEIVWVEVPTLTYWFHSYTWDSKII